MRECCAPVHNINVKYPVIYFDGGNEQNGYVDDDDREQRVTHHLQPAMSNHYQKKKYDRE